MVVGRIDCREPPVVSQSPAKAGKTSVLNDPLHTDVCYAVDVFLCSLTSQYDLVELRAVLACLPAKFGVDGDGRKAAWRAAFLQRVQGLVAQVRYQRPCERMRGCNHMPSLRFDNVSVMN